MVRTKSTTSHMVSMGKTPKVAACKASRSTAGGSGSTSNAALSPHGSSNKSKYSGGNSIHPREIPAWQKTITCFFPIKDHERSLSSSIDADEQSLEQETDNQSRSSKN